MLRQIGQMQNYVQSFMLNCEVKNISIVFKFYLGQLLKRYGQSVERCNVIVSDGKDEPFKIGEVMGRYICPHKTVILLLNRDVSHHGMRRNVVIDIHMLRFERGKDDITSPNRSIGMCDWTVRVRLRAIRMGAIRMRLSMLSMALHIWCSGIS